MRICHLGKYYPPAAGGIETHVRTLARAQAELGAEVRVLCVNHEAGASATVTEADGPVVVTRLGRRGSAAKLDHCPDLARELGRVEADVLHLQVPNPTMILGLLRARLAIPLVVSYQSDVIRQKLRAALFRPLERLAYRQARAILTSSPAYGLASRFLRAYGERITVLPNGIDLEPYLHPSAEDRSRSHALRTEHAERGPVWLACGRLVYYKGFTVAIRALTRVPGTLLLVGDGPDRRILEAEARRLGLGGRVRFLGALPHYLDLIPYYLAADAFWFPSNARSEAFGLVQVEAMASGCPVLNAAIAGSGVPWVSPHDESGLTVPVNDPVALADAASRLLAEPGLRDRLASGARARATREFDHRLMARRTLDLYDRLLSDPGRSRGAGRTAHSGAPRAEPHPLSRS